MADRGGYTIIDGWGGRMRINSIAQGVYKKNLAGTPRHPP